MAGPTRYYLWPWYARLRPIGGTVATVPGMMLVERDTELQTLAEHVGAAAGGAGTVALLEGAAGAGKSALVTWVAERAQWAGMQVRAAAGGELESDVPFGVARDLLGDLPTAGDPQGVVQALFYAVSALAEERPLALLIDDLHWVDEPSLRWIGYLARRAADLPVLLLLSSRPYDPAVNATVAAVTATAGVERVTVRPLSEQGIAELVTARLGEAPSAAFARECHSLTGGSPLFAEALLNAAAAARVRPRDAEAGRLGELSPPGVGEIVARALRAAGDDARALAPALAVLGAGQPLRRAAALAGIDFDRAEVAADALRHTGLLDRGSDLRFAHPVLRTALLETLLPGGRSRMHAEAARLLAAEGEAPSGIAAHLLHANPAGDASVVAPLREAARVAATSGAPEAAAALLRRALDEPPGVEDRAILNEELGRILLDVDPSAALDPLSIAVEAAPDPERRVALVLDRARGLFTAQRQADAVETVERALTELEEDDRRLRWRLEGELLAYQFFHDGTRHLRAARLDRLEREIDRTDPDAPPILVHLAVREAETGRVERALELTRAAWADGGHAMGDWTGSPLPVWAAYLFVYCGALDEAEMLVLRWQAEARSLGAPIRVAYAQAVLAEIRFRRGELRVAEADAATGWAAAGELGPGFVFWWVLLPGLVQARTATGDLDGAVAALTEAGLADAPVPDLLYLPSLREIRAQLWMAQGRLGEGVDELVAAGSWMADRIDVAGGSSWRGTAAEGMARLSRFEEAVALADEALALACDFGAPIPIAVALRAAAVSGAPEMAVETLEESVALLAASPARLEHARSLVELGAALRRINRRADARGPLTEGLDLAAALGARPLAARAREEMLAAGGRPRRERLSGVEALTASELRVAQMAAEGLSNPEIAQRLFVTRKTVEKHLGGAFAKLSVPGRDQLAEALRTSGEAPH